MSMTAGPHVLADLETLASVQRQLGQALSRIREASARSPGLVDQTAWRTDAATLFHASAEAWHRELTAAADAVAAARDEVAGSRSRIIALGAATTS